MPPYWSTYPQSRQYLLGHKSGRITTHHSAAELENLIEAAQPGVRGKLPQKSRVGVIETKSDYA